MSDKKMKHLWMVEDFTGRDGEKKGYWTKVGVAFENRDGSYTIELAAIPVNGRLQMRDPLPPKQLEQGNGTQVPAAKSAAVVQ